MMNECRRCEESKRATEEKTKQILFRWREEEEGEGEAAQANERKNKETGQNKESVKWTKEQDEENNQPSA